MMPKVAKLLGCACAAALLCGCMQAPQPEERAIVQAAAIDLLPQSCTITLQVFDPGSSGGFDGSDSYRLLSGSGATLTQALEDAAAVGSPIYFGSCRVLLVGQSAAPQLTDILTFFNSCPQTRATTLVGLVQGSAASLLGMQRDEDAPSPAVAVEQLLQQAQSQNRLPACRLMDLFAAAHTPGWDGVAPLLAVTEKEQQAAPVLAGSVVVPLGLQLTNHETTLLGLLRRGRGSIAMELAPGQTGSKQAVVVLERFTPSLAADLQAGLPHFAVSTTVTGHVAEWPNNPLPQQQLQTQLEQAAAHRLSDELTALLEKLCANGCDPLRFGERLRRADFRSWQQVEGQWGEVLSGAIFVVEVNCRLGSG